MKTKNTRWLALAGFAVAAITFIAWKNAGAEQSVNNFAPHYGFSETADTVPASARKKNREYRAEDIDQALEDLDRAMNKLDKNLKIDLSSIDKEVERAMEQVKKIDFEKLNKDITVSLNQVDWSSIKEEVKRALKEAEKEVQNVNKEAIRTGLESARLSISLNSDLIENSVKLGLDAAKIGLRKASQELKALKEFTTELEKDGLIDPKKGYKLRVKDHELYIDGKKQSKAVNDKYNKYFKDGDYSISMDDDDDDDDN